MIAVNHGDSVETINKYFDEKQFTFRTVMGGAPGDKNYAIFERYGVSGYPTNFLIDTTGKIVWSGVGFNEAGLRAALEKMGLK